MPSSDRAEAPPERLRAAETVLKRLGFSRVAPSRGAPSVHPSFWVQESGVPRRTFPVFLPPAGRANVGDRIDRWVEALRARSDRRGRAIFVVPNDAEAEEAWARLGQSEASPIDHEVSILVVPPSERGTDPPHFHLRLAEPSEILRFATGIVVGLFRRAQGSEGANPVDFEELLTLLKGRFGLDVHRSLGVRSDEDALFVLYQLALRDAYAPGDPGANLHLLDLHPTGPAARLPWFAG